MIDRRHYFDWAGTAPCDPDILNEALAASIEHWGNPSSIHRAGTDAKTALESARDRCARALGVPAERLTFTSGGTESDHIALLSVLTRPQKGSVLLSALEHPALREMASTLANAGWEALTVAPEPDGRISPQKLVAALKSDTAFVAVMAVNNETGAIQPVAEIADALCEHGKTHRKPFFHVDCVQAAGKIPIDLKHPGIDGAAFSAHKLGGPRGIGLLYHAREIQTFLRGGGQERNIRSGTENIFGATAIASCLERYCISPGNPAMEQRLLQQQEYTAHFLRQLLTIPTCTIIPHSRAEHGLQTEQHFSPWIVQAAFKGIPGQVMVRALDSKGFCISTGSACSSGKNTRPVLDSMRVSAAEKESAVRFSFGHDTTLPAMDELFREVRDVCRQFS